MKKNILILLLLLFQAHGFTYSQTAIKHFIFFGGNREAIHDSAFYLNPGIAGAQIIYTWKALEPGKDEYEFSEIKEDLEFLRSKGKKLFIQLQDVTFDSTRINVPRYLQVDTQYHGGANPNYIFPNNDESKPLNGGWVSRRWDEAVSRRLHKLIIELGKEFDGKIEGINLPETSLVFGSNTNLHPPGFTHEKYRDAIKANMRVLRTAFSKSVPIQYANFMPGESLPDDDKFYLKSIYDYAKQIRIGMGGPDIKVYKQYQMDHSYGLIRELQGIVPTGVAVQHGNYALVNPKTRKQVTIAEILDFAQDYLRLNYIFWCTEEPYYSKQVLPLLRSFARLH